MGEPPVADIVAIGGDPGGGPRGGGPDGIPPGLRKQRNMKEMRLAK